MGEVVPLKEDPTNYARALTRIKWLYRNGLFEIRPHALQRMRERGFETTDIQHVILYGKVMSHSHPGGYWRYVVRGKPPDKKQLDCVVEINDHLMVISIYDSKRTK